MKNPETGKRFVALSAAVAIGLGGVALTVPAMAANEAPKELSAAAASAFSASDKIAAIGHGENDSVVVQVVAGSDLDEGSEELEAVAAYAEASTSSDLQITEVPGTYSAATTKVDSASTAAPAAANAEDVVGGAGYGVVPPSTDADSVSGLCSFGFPATSADGEDAVITAGHCSDEGNDVYLEKPSDASAVNDMHADPVWSPLSDQKVGSFTYSQFGPTEFDRTDPDATNPDNYDPAETQDFAVITLDEAAGVTTHPEVTDWTTAEEDDLSKSTLPVSGVRDVTPDDINKNIVRSGRTSGLQEATIGYEETEPGKVPSVGGLVDGYAPIGMPDGTEIMVYGFSAIGLGIPGDSGGSVLMGDEAVGVVSGSNYNPKTEEGNFIWVAELHEGLQNIPGGYTINTTGDDEEPSPTPTATEDPTDEPTEDPTTPAPTPTDTDSPAPTPPDTDSPAPTPTDTDSPAPTPTDTDSPEPTETATDEPTTPAPTPSETEEADEDAELTVDPREIAAEQFLAEDEDQAIEQDRGVTYSVTGVEPGSDVTFDTYASTDSASANAGSEEAPAEDSSDAPAKSVTVTADEDGNASSRVWGLPTAPAEAYIGDYEVIVTAEGETLESSFEVVGEDGGDGGQDDGDNGEGGDDLPRTGSTTAPLAAGAAGLVALGGALVYVARRRKA